MDEVIEDNRITFNTRCVTEGIIEGETRLIPPKDLCNWIYNFEFLNPNYKIVKATIEYEKMEVK